MEKLLNLNEHEEYGSRSIIMGKSPSDVDIIGLSKTIHMRSCEKHLFSEKDYKIKESKLYPNSNHSDEETESTTPI